MVLGRKSSWLPSSIFCPLWIWLYFIWVPTKKRKVSYFGLCILFPKCISHSTSLPQNSRLTVFANFCLSFLYLFLVLLILQAEIWFVSDKCHLFYLFKSNIHPPPRPPGTPLASLTFNEIQLPNWFNFFTSCPALRCRRHFKTVKLGVEPQIIEWFEFLYWIWLYT